MQFVPRIWGWYLVLFKGRHFKVKLLRFSGKHRMSRQYHRQREELWLFLTGKRKGKWKLNRKGQIHTYTGGKAYAIEIQFGAKCTEEDIVRI